ncbi:glycoside hydrolase family 35 protein [Chiua virens]|nr:glycoside hydrolase family 35 protein [Chiua virens]
MISIAKELEVTQDSCVYSKAEDGVPLPSAATKTQRKGFSPGWAFVVLLSAVLSIIVFPLNLKSSSVRSPPFPETADVVDALGQQTVVKPVVATSGLTGNGRTNEVLWDKHSLVLKGQRIFIHSGEFHPFRLPVPGLWLDVFQKIKAAGFNAVSIYTHMSLINPSPGVIDLDDYRSLKPLYEAAKQTGLWIVLRPGPYINAETTAGGIAHWITSQVAGELRTNATDWKAAWQDYIQAIIRETVPYQITEGGPVIAIQLDNEYSQSPISHAQYFLDLQSVFKNSSIVVPLTANDAGAERNWINGTGSVDIYGIDAYPQNFDCSHPKVWNPVDTSYYSYHASVNPGHPLYFPEFQGGAFDAWGPTAPGYEPCRILTGSDFESVFNLNLWAANAKLINYYMLYGGTSWGGLPFPGVYTSYDYGSAIAENRELTDKYSELKRQGLFLRSSPEFYKTDYIGDSASGAVEMTNDAAFATLLTNPDTNASFFVARQNDSTSTATTNFKLKVTTSAGSFQIPRVASAITLSGRQSKVVVTDYSFGSSKVLYSTAQVLYAGKIGIRDVLFLYGDPSQEHETALRLTGVPRLQAQIATISYTFINGVSTVTFLAGIEGLVTVWDSSEQLVLYSDTATAGTFWSPEIPMDPSDSFANYWQYGTNTSVLIGGPYLVRNASVSGRTLVLRGDLCCLLQLLNRVDSLLGYPLQLLSTGMVAPRLTNWKYANSLPEIGSDFSDTNWTTANRTETNIPFKPHYGDGRVLYGCDYGYCENIVLWRGHFTPTEDTKWVNLSINGGEAFAASIWVNDVFLNTSYGKTSWKKRTEVFYFPPGSLRYNEDNVITILQDNMGLDQNGDDHVDKEKSPRGVRGFMLNAGEFGEWKVQGKVGGYSNYPDKVRGVLNEGGLYGERLGWHLPGYNTSSWEARDLSQGLPNATTGVGFFVTTFELDISEELDVLMSFTFDRFFQSYRAQLYVNGWMMGKRVANLGPQWKFPVQQGILDYNGVNTVAVALWAMESNQMVPTLELTVDGVYEGGVGGIEVNNPSWTAEGREER